VDSSLKCRKSLQAGRSAPPLAKKGTRTTRPAVPGSRAPRQGFRRYRGDIVSGEGPWELKERQRTFPALSGIPRIPLNAEGI
jgi:hypothetical protein